MGKDSRHIAIGSVRSPDQLHWHHEIGPFRESLDEARGLLVSALLSELRGTAALAAIRYRRGDRRVRHWLPVTTASIRRRGLLFTKQVVLEIAPITDSQAIAETLSDLWSQGDNETLIFCPVDSATLTSFVRENWIDDVEANTSNEHDLISISPWVASRGWDGRTLRVLSNALDGDRFIQMTRAAIARSDTASRLDLTTDLSAVQTPPCEVALALRERARSRQRIGTSD